MSEQEKDKDLTEATRETSTLTLASIAIASSLILLTVGNEVLSFENRRILGLATAILGILYRELTIHLYFARPKERLRGMKWLMRSLRAIIVRLYQMIPIIAWWFFFGGLVIAIVATIALFVIEEIRYHDPWTINPPKK